MKKSIYKSIAFAALFGMASAFTACSDDDTSGSGTGPIETPDRFITVAGAVMGAASDAVPGDGNGGTLVYSLTKEQAMDPTLSFDVFENGYLIPSTRTARVQSSEDGSTIFSIAYGGSNGGEYSKLQVSGGQNFTPVGGTVNISQYATTSPRWVKLFDGDNTGVAVNVTSPVVVNAEDGSYLRTRGTAAIVSIDLVGSFITQTRSFEIPLTAEEEAQGHHIFRLDAPVLNAAGNKLIIGTWMRKTNTATGSNQANFDHLGSKSVVVDYPSLENPVVITSTISNGDTSGYRSFNSFLGEDGNIYQATQRDANGGSHILKISQNNTYDNSYVFSLDAALGIQGAYIENWRYAGNGKALVAYTHDNATVSALTQNSQSFLALVDLNAKTAVQVDLPYHTDMYLFQYQGYVVDGNTIFVTLAAVGQEGRIYMINKNNGQVTEGARLVNKPGNHFIGAF